MRDMSSTVKTRRAHSTRTNKKKKKRRRRVTRGIVEME
jgi:hypothetical protein